MTGEPPTVTVLMSVHNGEAYLGEAIKSILEQTFSNFEFLIIDDGSTDGSLEIIHTFQDKDPRIRILQNQWNIGLPASLNLGLQQACGQYIARQDADDLSLPERLDAQVEILNARPDVQATGCWFQSIDANGNLFGSSQPTENNPTVAEQLASGINPLAHGSIIFRKKTVLDLGGYDERFWFGQDFDLWLRLFQEGRHAAIVPQYLYQRRKLPSDSAFKTLCQKRYGELALQQLRSGKKIEFNDVRSWVRDQHPESLRPDPEVRGKYWMLLAITALGNEKRPLARSYSLNAFKTPRLKIRLKAACLFFFSLLPFPLLLKQNR